MTRAPLAALLVAAAHSENLFSRNARLAQLTKRLANDYRWALQCKRRHDNRDDEIGPPSTAITRP